MSSPLVRDPIQDHALCYMVVRPLPSSNLGAVPQPSFIFQDVDVFEACRPGSYIKSSWSWICVESLRILSGLWVCPHPMEGTRSSPALEAQGATMMTFVGQWNWSSGWLLPASAVCACCFLPVTSQPPMASCRDPVLHRTSLDSSPLMTLACNSPYCAGQHGDCPAAALTARSPLNTWHSAVNSLSPLTT